MEIFDQILINWFFGNSLVVKRLRVYFRSTGLQTPKLDRLGRKARDLSEMAEDLEKRKIDFVSLTDNIDTSSAAGRFFFNIMASLAQMERELMLERTKAGLDAARLKGRVGGRKRKMTESKVTSAKKLLEAGALPKDVAKDLGVSIATLYRWIPAGMN